MKYQIGDKLRSKDGNFIITIINYKDDRYVIEWDGGYPILIDESKLDEHYDMIEAEK